MSDEQQLGPEAQPAAPQCSTWERGWASAMPPAIVAKAMRKGLVRRSCVLDLLPEEELSAEERRLVERMKRTRT